MRGQGRRKIAYSKGIGATPLVQMLRLARDGTPGAIPASHMAQRQRDLAERPAYTVAHRPIVATPGAPLVRRSELPTWAIDGPEGGALLAHRSEPVLQTARAMRSQASERRPLITHRYAPRGGSRSQAMLRPIAQRWAGGGPGAYDILARRPAADTRASRQAPRDAVSPYLPVVMRWLETAGARGAVGPAADEHGRARPSEDSTAPQTRAQVSAAPTMRLLQPLRAPDAPAEAGWAPGSTAGFQLDEQESEPAPDEVDIEALARQVYGRIRRRLLVEAERLGR